LTITGLVLELITSSSLPSGSNIMLPNMNELTPEVQVRPSTTCCWGGWLHSVLTPRARCSVTGKPPAGDDDCPRALPLPRLDAFRSNLLLGVRARMGYRIRLRNHFCLAYSREHMALRLTVAEYVCAAYSYYGGGGFDGESTAAKEAFSLVRPPRFQTDQPVKLITRCVPPMHVCRRVLCACVCRGVLLRWLKRGALDAWPSCARCPRLHANVCTSARAHTQNTHTRQGVAGVISALDALHDGGVVSVNLTEPADERPRGFKTRRLPAAPRVCVRACNTHTHVGDSLGNTRVSYVCAHTHTYVLGCGLLISARGLNSREIFGRAPCLSTLLRLCLVGRCSMCVRACVLEISGCAVACPIGRYKASEIGP
jgi:hypothetical protein